MLIRNVFLCLVEKKITISSGVDWYLLPIFISVVHSISGQEKRQQNYIYKANITIKCLGEQ